MASSRATAPIADAHWTRRRSADDELQLGGKALGGLQLALALGFLLGLDAVGFGLAGIEETLLPFVEAFAVGLSPEQRLVQTGRPDRALPDPRRA